MKYFFSVLVLLTGISCAQNCKATLTIKTDNELAFVVLNDSSHVNGRESSHELEPGTYIITIGENSDRWDAKTFKDTIIIKGCEDVTKTYYFFKRSYLDTEPQDAYVFTADTLLGHTPLLLPPNIADITLRKPGYQEKIIRTNTLTEFNKINLRPEPLNENGSFFESPLFLYLSGSLLVFGGVTAYYKLQADDKYAEFQVSGEQKLLDKTRRLDTISGIAFTALQINFGFLLYYFLTD